MALSIVKCETFIAYWRKLLVTRVREKGVSNIPHAESRIGSPIGPGAGRFPPSDAYKSSLGILMVGWICALVIGGEVVKGSLAYRIRSFRRRGWDRPAPGLPRSGPHVRGSGEPSNGAGLVSAGVWALPAGCGRRSPAARPLRSSRRARTNPPRERRTSRSPSQCPRWPRALRAGMPLCKSSPCRGG
jgi:hypothetical protein